MGSRLRTISACSGRCIPGVLLLVEGQGDETVFDRFCAEDECSIVVCLGKKNVLDAVDQLGMSGFVGALGLADRDF